MTPTDDGDTRVQPFTLRVPESEIGALRARLAAVRWPDRESLPEAAGRARWSQGVPLADLRALVDRWHDEYDWRAVEHELADAGQLLLHLGGVHIHCLHHRSRRIDAAPLLLTHGWPGSIVEFLDVLEDLAHPPDPSLPAFHIIAPSLPGFGFSSKPAEAGWGVERIADTWAELMTALGYDDFFAHGGDWGAVVTTVLAARHPERVAAMHTTFPQVPPGLTRVGLTSAECALIDATEAFWARRSAYARQQATRPQTLAYALDDSPVGLLAWMLDKFAEWSDTDDSPFESIAADRILDNVTLHWLGRSGGSSARIYWESYGRMDPALTVHVPTAISLYPREFEQFPRRWVAERYRNITRWSERPRGGHFPSLEVPRDFVAELRAAFG
nr:epoxide hydrolase family protein [Mycolicibacterium sp. 018/SC-01/001]